MSLSPRALRLIAPVLLVSPLLAAVPAHAGQTDKSVATVRAPAAVAAPRFAQPDDPWIYRGTDIPVDRQWLFGELPNGLRYAVRRNGVPPGQVSIRVRIDAGSLYEQDSERGFAHLIEHLVFRESSVFGNGEAIPHFQRLGAGLGTDTNALTYPTQTIFHLDLPNVTAVSLDDSLRRIAGMIRDPKLSTANLAVEVPIVLAERRERAGPEERMVNSMNETFFAGQPMANRDAIGTVETLQAATPPLVSPGKGDRGGGGRSAGGTACCHGRSPFRGLESGRCQCAPARFRHAARPRWRRSCQSGGGNPRGGGTGATAQPDVRHPAPVASGDR
jgi:zinc protease